MAAENEASAPTPRATAHDDSPSSDASHSSGSVSVQSGRQLKSQGAEATAISKSSQSGTQTSRTLTKTQKKGLAYAGAALLSVLTFGAISMPKKPGGIERPIVRPKLCMTDACKLLMDRLTRYDRKDHCADFYTAVCGIVIDGKPEDWPGENISSQFSYLTAIEDQIFSSKLEAFGDQTQQSKLASQFRDSEVQMGKMYRSCLMREEGHNDSRKFYFELLEDIGAPFGSDIKRQHLSMFSVLMRLSLIWGVKNPLFFVELRPLRGEKFFMTVVQTAVGDLLHNQIKISSVRRKRAAVKNITANIIEFRSHLARYWSNESYPKQKTQVFEFLNEIFKEGYEVDEEYLKEMARDYVTVWKFLEWLELSVWYDSHHEVKQQFEQIEKEDKFPFRRALTYGVSEYVNFSTRNTWYVSRGQCSTEIMIMLLDPRLHRVFRHYLSVWLLKEASFAFSKEAEKKACEFDQNSCGKEESVTYCMKKIREYFPRSYSALHNKTLVSYKSILQVKLALSSLILNSAKMIKMCTWMHDEDKVDNLRDLATMVIYISAPEYLKDHRGVEYKNPIGRNYLQNLLTILRSRAEDKLINFERPFRVSSKRWPHMPLTRPVATYDVETNVLVVPSPLLAYPHHLSGGPLWYTVAGMGWQVVHKMFHGFDFYSREAQLRSLRSKDEWHPLSQEKFRNFTECFKRTYEEIKHFFPKDMSIEDEAIIDNAVVWILESTFTFLEVQFPRTMLPSSKWPYPAVYIIASVKPFCYTLYRYRNKKKSHSFSRARINQALKSLKRLPPGFRCDNTTKIRTGGCESWAP